MQDTNNCRDSLEHEPQEEEQLDVHFSSNNPIIIQSEEAGTFQEVTELNVQQNLVSEVTIDANHEENNDFSRADADSNQVFSKQKNFTALQEFSLSRQRDNRGRFIKIRKNKRTKSKENAVLKDPFITGKVEEDLSQANFTLTHDEAAGTQSNIIGPDSSGEQEAQYPLMLSQIVEASQELQTPQKPVFSDKQVGETLLSSQNHIVVSAMKPSLYTADGQSQQHPLPCQNTNQPSDLVADHEMIQDGHFTEQSCSEMNVGPEGQCEYKKVRMLYVNNQQINKKEKTYTNLNDFQASMDSQKSKQEPSNAAPADPGNNFPLSQQLSPTKETGQDFVKCSQLTFGNFDSKNVIINGDHIQKGAIRENQSLASNKLYHLLQGDQEAEDYKNHLSKDCDNYLEVEDDAEDSPPKITFDGSIIEISGFKLCSSADSKIYPTTTQGRVSTRKSMRPKNEGRSNLNVPELRASQSVQVVSLGNQFQHDKFSFGQNSSSAPEEKNASTKAKGITTRNRGKRTVKFADVEPNESPTLRKNSVKKVNFDAQDNSPLQITNQTPVEASQDSLSQDEQIVSNPGNPDSMSKQWKQQLNSYEECVKIYKKMFMFDWDLKDIINQRHCPKEELTSGAFWFYQNTTFFPHSLQDVVCNQSFEEWVVPILDTMRTFTIKKPVVESAENSLTQQQSLKVKFNNKLRNLQYLQDKMKNQQQNQSNIYFSDQLEHLQYDEEEQQDITFVSKLIGKKRRFTKFKQHYQHLSNRATSFDFTDEEINEIQENATKIPKLSENNPEEKNDAEQEIAEIKQKMKHVNFQKILCLAEKDLEMQQDANLKMLQDLFLGVRDKFSKALALEKTSEGFHDMTVYTGADIGKQDQDFMSFVDPTFVQDMVKNKEWYDQNLNMFLMNINYPCKLQYDCLKEMELIQQRRNDQKYRKILDQMDHIEQIKHQANQGDVKAIEELKRIERELGSINLNTQQRTQLAQEDALCAICGIGDYEDNDQIVFCFTCSMPVHQSCFGLDTIPENDWVCNNCATYQLQRGLMIKCMLCPKRGGAMKPTNIFASYEKFYDHKNNNQKKMSKKTKDKISPIQPELLSQQNASMNYSERNDISKVACHQRIEQNTSLTELLIREEAYFKMTLDEYDKRVTEIELGLKDPSYGNLQLTDSMKVIKLQEELQLNFNKHEIKNHNIPEDYNNFIKRNERLLEIDAPATDTLYHWVHHSCAMWLKEPIVTPKTPVNMKKLDYNRFLQGCFICCKKGADVGACVKCCKSECQVWFHVECAKRQNYCMEIEKKGSNCPNKEKVFKLYCESHRPFKILQIINEQNRKEIEDIQKFTKTIEKAIELQKKSLLKPKKLISKAERNKMLRQALQSKKHELNQIRREFKMQSKPRKEKRLKLVKAKKWSKSDIKNLMARVREKFLMIIKMRINFQRIDPMISESKKYKKKIKRLQKQQDKKKKAEGEIKFKIEVFNSESDKALQDQDLRVKQELEEAQMMILDHNEIEGGEKEAQNEEQDLDLNETNQEEDIDLKTNEQLNINEVEMHKDDSLQVEIVHGSVVTNPNKITLNFQSGQETPCEMEVEIEEEEDDCPLLQEIPEYYKHATPLTISELEWTVTLSRYDFPWNEICFAPFTARECYNQYRSLVKDPFSFLKKVLGDKPKFQKMMSNQINGLPTKDTLLNMSFVHKRGLQPDIQFQVAGSKANQGLISIDKFARVDHGQEAPPGALIEVYHHPTLNMPIPIEGTLINPLLYCKCKGKNLQEFMVFCESGEKHCINGGWLHPECTIDLANKCKEEIDAIDIWYCDDCCIQRRNEILQENPEYEVKILSQEQARSALTRALLSQNTHLKQSASGRVHDPASENQERSQSRDHNQSQSMNTQQPPSSQADDQKDNARKQSLIISIDNANEKQTPPKVNNKPKPPNNFSKKEVKHHKEQKQQQQPNFKVMVSPNKKKKEDVVSSKQTISENIPLLNRVDVFMVQQVKNHQNASQKPDSSNMAAIKKQQAPPQLEVNSQEAQKPGYNSQQQQQQSSPKFIKNQISSAPNNIINR